MYFQWNWKFGQIFIPFTLGYTFKRGNCTERRRLVCDMIQWNVYNICEYRAGYDIRIDDESECNECDEGEGKSVNSKAKRMSKESRNKRRVKWEMRFEC